MGMYAFVDIFDYDDLLVSSIQNIVEDLNHYNKQKDAHTLEGEELHYTS